MQNEIDSLLLSNPNASFNLISQQNGYRVSEKLGYKNGALNKKAMEIFDSNQNMICYQVFDKTKITLSQQEPKKFIMTQMDRKNIYLTTMKMVLILESMIRKILKEMFMRLK